MNEHRANPQSAIRNSQSEITFDNVSKFYGEILGVNRVSLRSEEHTSELQSQSNLVCRLLLEKKKTNMKMLTTTPFQLSVVVVMAVEIVVGPRSLSSTLGPQGVASFAVFLCTQRCDTEPCWHQ